MLIIIFLDSPPSPDSMRFRWPQWVDTFLVLIALRKFRLFLFVLPFECLIKTIYLVALCHPRKATIHILREYWKTQVPRGVDEISPLSTQMPHLLSLLVTVNFPLSLRGPPAERRHDMTVWTHSLAIGSTPIAGCQLSSTTNKVAPIALAQTLLREMILCVEYMTGSTARSS